MRGREEPDPFISASCNSAVYSLYDTSYDNPTIGIKLNPTYQEGVGTRFSAFIKEELIKKGVHSKIKFAPRNVDVGFLINDVKRDFEEFGDIPPPSEGVEKIAIPITMDEHFMVLLVDLKNKSITFQDSQGKDPSERKLRDSDKTLLDNLEAIKDFYFPGEKEVPIRYTQHARQIDRHHCVIHVCDFLYKSLLEENSYEDFLNNQTDISKFKIDVVRKSILELDWGIVDEDAELK